MEFTIFWSALTIGTGIFLGLTRAAHILREVHLHHHHNFRAESISVRRMEEDK